MSLTFKFKIDLNLLFFLTVTTAQVTLNLAFSNSGASAKMELASGVIMKSGS